MTKYVLAIDQGTTSSRAVLFDRESRVVAMAQEEYRQHYPRPGWVEHDPEEIWASVVRTCREAIGQAGATPKDLVALGMPTSARPSLFGSARPASQFTMPCFAPGMIKATYGTGCFALLNTGRSSLDAVGRTVSRTRQ